tara:strand:- start:143 stop:322 length:180 start_codon:yes stop_codon:yes gene_type:complete
MSKNNKKFTAKEVENFVKNALNENLAKEGRQINDESFDSHFKVIRVSDFNDKNKEENNE